MSQVDYRKQTIIGILEERGNKNQYSSVLNIN